MPPLPRLTLPQLTALESQLRYAPPEALRRHIDRAEQLAGEIDPGAAYPVDWINYRITGFRAEGADAPSGLVAGHALLADLSALVERLCESAGLGAAEMPAARDADALGTHWGVSRKTIDRWRKRGLIARRVTGQSGRPRLMFSPSSVAAFEKRHPDEIRRAASFSRIAPDLQARILRRAERYRRRFGCSTARIAQRLADRFDRSPEAVRQVLKRARAEQETQRTGTARRASGPITLRHGKISARAMRRGIGPGELSQRWGHSAPSILRAANLARVAALQRHLPLATHTSPTFVRDDAADVILSPASVTTGLGRPGMPTLAEWVAAARAREVPVGVEEFQRTTALCYLRWRAHTGLAAVDRLHPSGPAVDRVQTDLLWASRIKAELVRAQLGLALQTVESLLNMPIHRLRPADAVPLAMILIRAVAESVDQFDPFRAYDVGARLAGSVSPAVTRMTARWIRESTPPAAAASGPPPTRATGLYRLDTPIPDWTRRLDPWQAMLEPDSRLRGAYERLANEEGNLIADRFGLRGAPPRTIAELAAAAHTTAMRMAAAERRALRIVLAAARLAASP